MKQFLLTLLSITVIAFTQFAQDGFKKPVGNNNTNKTIVHRPHKSHNYTWSGSSWIFIDSSDYVYNVQGQATNSISRNGNYYTERITSNYDNLFQPTLEIKDDYDHINSTWKPGIKHQIDYNGMQDIILDERYVFDSGNWELWLGTKNTYQYDNNNRISEIVEFTYDEFAEVYRENIKFSDIVYDTQNNILERILSFWNTSQQLFVYEEKQVNTYNPDNTIAARYAYEWNTNTSSWDNYYRVTYTYGANGSYSSLIESYSSNAYHLSGSHGEDYDSHGNRTRYYSESWDEMNSQLILIEDYVDNYLYDMNDYLIQHIHKELNSFTLQAENIYRKDYYDFETFDSQVGVSTNEEEMISIYPNPMETTSVIDFSKLQEKVQSITVFNAAGLQMLFVPVLENHKVILTNEQLKNGLYLIVIETDTQVIQSRIIVE